MKAKDYFKQFNEENQDKIPEWRLIFAFNQMFNEVKEVAKMRNAKSNSAMISIFNEQNQKANSFIRMLNVTDYFTENGRIYQDAFKLYLQEKNPDFYKLVFS